jgi:hypothetical protein
MKPSSGRASEYHVYPFPLEWQEIACAPQDKELEIRLIKWVFRIEKFALDDVQRKEGFGAWQENEIHPTRPKQILQFNGKVQQVSRREPGALFRTNTDVYIRG